MITIGITTYNRINILKKMAKSFYLSNLEIPYNICVYDDCSSEYSINEIREIFVNAKNIIRNPINVGASKNNYLMYKAFLESNDQYLFNADSDLIFSKNWLNIGLDYLKKTDGVLSLLNAQNLKPAQQEDNELIIKDKIGAAGALLTRETVENILENITIEDLRDKSDGFDFLWCKHLTKQGKKIYCVRDSLVQHIGVDGESSLNNYFDVGVNFTVDSLINGQIINDSMEVYFTMNRKKKNYFIFPFEKIKPKTKIIIYGFGKVGQDFIKQIERTGYCDIVGIVDKNYSKINGLKRKVYSPDMIKELEADYVVVAVNSDQLANEIIEEIKKEDEFLVRKVVYEKNRIMYL